MKYINLLLQSELDKGITVSLVEQLKSGNAGLITQETWNQLADWLESGCKKPKGRPPTGESHEKYSQNINIKLEYKAMRNEILSKLERIIILAEKYKMDERHLQKIIDR